MTLKISGHIKLHTPQFPTDPQPNNGDVWVDPVTNVSWTYQSSTETWKLS